VSEVPETQRDARVGSARDDAWSAVREAQSAWAGAMRSHELAPPDGGLRDRVRALSDAADAMRATHARALEAGLAWRPVEGSERARPPYELRPGTGRRGPEQLWERFDAAVERLNHAGAGDSLADLVAAYAAVAEAAAALADALEDPDK
jgi:hypothetical protein